MRPRDVVLLLLIAVVVGTVFEGVTSLVGDDDFETGDVVRLSVIALVSMAVVRVVRRTSHSATRSGD